MSAITCLVGSTASGKTEVALKIAQATGAHILSCDSLLVYKDLYIGTAKPSTEELAAVPHYGINLSNIDTPFTAGDYVRYATPLLADLVARKIPVLIVGGTGFYLKALLFGVWDAPATQPEFRAKLEQEMSALPPEERGPQLYPRLADKDPVYAAKISPHDLYRIIRALEIMEVTGERLSERLNHHSLQNPLPYPYKIFGIRRNSQDLERRIIARTNNMFAAGLVNEVKALMQQYPDLPKPLHSVGYAEVLAHFQGKLTFAECRERIVISTRQLAKKQRTFFKPFPGITWFDLPAHQEELEATLSKSFN